MGHPADVRHDTQFSAEHSDGRSGRRPSRAEMLHHAHGDHLGGHLRIQRTVDLAGLPPLSVHGVSDAVLSHLVGDNFAGDRKLSYLHVPQALAIT